jgi:hypothetical protein
MLQVGKVCHHGQRLQFTTNPGLARWTKKVVTATPERMECGQTFLQLIHGLQETRVSVWMVSERMAAGSRGLEKIAGNNNT